MKWKGEEKSDSDAEDPDALRDRGKAEKFCRDKAKLPPHILDLYAEAGKGADHRSKQTAIINALFVKSEKTGKYHLDAKNPPFEETYIKTRANKLSLCLNKRRLTLFNEILGFHKITPKYSKAFTFEAKIRKRIHKLNHLSICCWLFVFFYSAVVIVVVCFDFYFRCLVILLFLLSFQFLYFDFLIVLDV